MKGGYVLIDCEGLNLLEQDPQTIIGLHNKVKKASELNKPVYAYNCIFGEGLSMTPVPIMVNLLPGSETSYVCTAATLQIIIAEDDTVTINNLAPSNRSVKSSK